MCDTLEFSLSEIDFWERSMAERAAASAQLRARREPAFFAEVDYGIIPPGPGYYALVRHSDVTAASRNSVVFASTPSAISREDLPAEFNEYFGSMINMDDPKHANIRQIVEELLEAGPCDFVSAVAAQLPLKVICDMMGTPERDHAMVLEHTSTIVGGFDPELLGADPAARVRRVLGAGHAMHELAKDLAAFRRESPGDDLTPALGERERRRRDAHRSATRCVLHAAGHRR